LFLVFQGRRASLRSALAPGYYILRRWRSGGCTSNLKSSIAVERELLVESFAAMKNEKWKIFHAAFVKLMRA